MQAKTIEKKVIKIGILIWIVAIPQMVLGQKNFKAGYIIKNNADTVQGWVDYRNWEKNPKKIKFKTEEEMSPVSYSPGEISAVGIDNERYVSAIVETENSYTKTYQLEKNPELKLKTDTVFLQTLFDGPKSLYYYQSPEGFDNFYIKQDKGYELLVYKKYLRRQEDKDVITENNKFLGQLTLYLSDCGTISSKLENTSYSKKNLTKLFQYYYGCSQSNLSFQKKVERAKVKFGVVAGVTSTSLSFRGDDFDELEDVSEGSFTSFSGGVFLDVILARNQGKWSIYNEAFLTSYMFEGGYEDFRSEDEFTIISTEMGYTYLKLNNLLRYNIPMGSTTLFLNAGISSGLAIKETNYERRDIRFFSTDRVREGKVLNQTRKYEQGFVLGAGLRFNKLSVETRFEKGNGMSSYPNLKSSTTRYHFLLGYRF